MLRFGRRTAMRAMGLLTIGTLACAASLMTVTESAHAQISDGDFWLFQPHQPAPVGRAWCNADHTVEYWAYVVGEYQWPSDTCTAGGNHWELDVQRLSSAAYPSFNCFKNLVLAQPEMAGKTIRFENHSVVGETVGN